VFYPSAQWLTGLRPVQQYVLADLYAWLEADSGLSHPMLILLLPAIWRQI